jgi:hypothetical protein
MPGFSGRICYFWREFSGRSFSGGGRQIVLVSTAGFFALNTGIFWREAKTKRLFSQCVQYLPYGCPRVRFFISTMESKIFCKNNSSL